MKKPNPMQSLWRSLLAFVGLQTDPQLQTRRYGLRLVSQARALLTISALAALAVPTRSLAQAPTFNTLITTYKGGPNWAHPVLAAVGDFNGDGKLDALISDGQTSLRLLLGNGDGTFTEHDIDVNPAGLTPPPTPVEIRAADFNGDGKLDVVFVSPQGNLAPTVLINQGNDANGVPQFTATTYTPVYGGLRSVTVGDLNGDGKPDFIVGSAYGFLQVYLNNGDGTFTAGQSMYILQPNPNGSVGFGVIADLNGDGNADYVVTDNQSGATDIFWGNGDGTFQTTPLILPNNANSIAVADLNGDGKLDLLAVENGTPNQLLVYLNTGGGSFSAPTRYSTGGTQWNGWTAVTTADMNGDGKLDVVVANSGGNNVAVLLGDGSGTFGAPALFPVNVTPLDVAVGDFNGDGKPDIATVGYNDDTYGVLLNTTVFPAPALPTPPEIFSRTTANGESWQLYTVAFSPTQSGSYTLGFNITATDGGIVYQGANHDDHSIYLDDVRVTSASGVSGDTFKSGFESPVVTAQQVYPNGTFGDWVFSNFSGVIPGSPSQWGPVGPEEGNQRGFVQAYKGTLSNIETATTFHLDAGQTYTVTYWQASRSGPVGNEGVLTYTVTIDKVAGDTTPPVITAPANIIAEATGPSGAVVTFTATATDNVGVSSLSYNHASGSTFPIGPTTVTVTAKDAADNTATASFTITVRDTTPPVISPVANITVEASGAAGAVATFAATATDAVGVTSFTSSAASGSTFPIGTTTVKLTAKDAAGNSASGSFTITVSDTTAPALTVPASQVLEATSAAGATATFAATATDAVGVTSLTSSAASGSTFSIGTTTVTVIAKDAANNTSSGSFTVTVRDTTAPVISSLTASSTSLWPPNHKMVAITLTPVASDAVGVTSLKIIGATSNEPDNGLGDGDTAGDIEITGALTLNLRAERSGAGNGRVYTITVEAKDAAGNATTKTVTVSVPKSQVGK
jgi:PBP1b-binding outer membrane lipoprotein LpoB